MKVILLETVPKLGKSGQVVTVADGYARNYLFPRKFAILAEKNQLAVLERRNAKLSAQLAETKSAAEALKEKLDGLQVDIQGKVGHELGKLFGAITSQDIVDAIKDQLKFSVEKKQVVLHEPLKRLGRHNVMIDLHREVDANVIVRVFDPEHPEEETAIVEAEPEVETAVTVEEVVETVDA